MVFRASWVSELEVRDCGPVELVHFIADPFWMSCFQFILMCLGVYDLKDFNFSDLFFR